MNPTIDLVTVEEPRTGRPFAGRHPPRTLDEFFSEVLDVGVFEGFFSNSNVDDVTQSNIAAAAIQDRHNHMNNIMKKHNLILYQDDYNGRDNSRPLVCRPPFDALYIMTPPLLGEHTGGKIPHVGVFSTKHMLLFKSKGWHQSTCLYFSEESDIPASILDCSAWRSSSNCPEGRGIVERYAATATCPDVQQDFASTTFEQKFERMSVDWWSAWNNGHGCQKYCWMKNPYSANRINTTISPRCS